MRLNLNRFFKFENKIGWSEAFALLAIIISIISLYQSYRVEQSALPNIVVTEKTPTIIVSYDTQQRQWIYLTYNRIIITNRGGRTVTLIGIRPPEEPEELPMVLPVKNGKVDENIKINASIFPTSELLEDIKNNHSLLSKYKGIGIERLSVLNIPIEPGETKVLNLGIIFDAYSGNERIAETIFFGVNLVFGDGENYWYRHGYKIEEISDVIRKGNS